MTVYLVAQLIWHYAIIQCMQNHNWNCNTFNAAIQLLKV